jgi:hypothetical protein
LQSHEGPARALRRVRGRPGRQIASSRANASP